MNLFKHNKSLDNNSVACELYTRLNSDMYKSGSWRTEDNGEDMAVVSQVIMQYWKPRFLMDHRTQCAYEFMDGNEALCTVTQDDIDWDSLKSVSDESVNRARNLDFHFPSFVRKYENGVAQVSWQLNPDGMYYMDEDGYGMIDDDEVEIYGFIDHKGNVVVKFQHINEDWNRLKKIRKEAESKVSNQ
ncbi:MAG: hypothetical protein NC116_09535 [Clostridium sp.]|nr:hypothetical protein [Clostridium sp.]